MTNQAQQPNTNRQRIGAFACLAILLTACSKDPAPEPVAPAKTAKSGFIVPDDSGAGSSTTSGPPRSIFMVGKRARDPFFPQAEPTAEPAIAGTAQTVQAKPADVVSLLQDGLQWIVGTGTERVALLNNVMLTPNKVAKIPLQFGGKQELVTLRCISIEKNTVSVLIQGHSSPITLSKIPKN